MSPEIERSRPAFVQVADHLRDQIVRGELLPGDPVPSIRELAATWKIARATAEKALNTLRSEGLVEPVSGVATVVTGAAPPHRTVIDRYATVHRTGHIYTAGEHAKIVIAEECPAPNDVAAALRIDPGSPVIRRHRVTYLGDTPRTSSTSWFPATLRQAAPKLLTTERIPEGTGRYVEVATGLTIRHGQEQILARLASTEEAAELGKPEPLAVLETRHTAWDEQDRPITYEVRLAPAGYQYTYRYEIGDRPGR